MVNHLKRLEVTDQDEILASLLSLKPDPILQCAYLLQVSTVVKGSGNFISQFLEI